MKIFLLLCLVACLPGLIKIDFSKFKNLPGKIPIAEGEREITVLASEKFFTPPEEDMLFLSFENSPREKEIVKLENGQTVLQTVMNLHFQAKFLKVKATFEILSQETNQAGKKSVNLAKVHNFALVEQKQRMTVDEMKKMDRFLVFARDYINDHALAITPENSKEAAKK